MEARHQDGRRHAGLKVGDAVAEMTYGAFSEWGLVQAKVALPVPTCAPEIVALLTSGLTASIGEPLRHSLPAHIQVGIRHVGTGPLLFLVCSWRVGLI